MNRTERDTLSNHLRKAARFITQGDDSLSEEIIASVKDALWRDKAQERYDERQRVNVPWPQKQDLQHEKAICKNHCLPVANYAATTQAMGVYERLLIRCRFAAALQRITMEERKCEQEQQVVCKCVKLTGIVPVVLATRNAGDVWLEVLGNIGIEWINFCYFNLMEERKMKVYVQRKGQGYLETVDEYESRIEAVQMLTEYRLSDPSAHYYLSSKPCHEWIE